MVLVLPERESFAKQMRKGLEQGMGQGLANMPNTMMDFIKLKQQKEMMGGDLAVDLAKQGAEGSKRKPPSLEEQMRIRQQAAKVSKGSPLEMQQAITDQRVKEEDKMRHMEDNMDPDRSYKNLTDIFTGESSEGRKSKYKKLQKQLAASGKSAREIREFAADKGFAPEELEALAGPLAKEVTPLIEEFPQLRSKVGLWHGIGSVKPLDENQKEYFKNHLRSIFEQHPNANPLLLRKEFEEKGIPWRDYKDAIESLEEEGMLEQNEHYPAIAKYLSSPPLGPLRKALHGIKLVGR